MQLTNQISFISKPVVGDIIHSASEPKKPIDIQIILHESIRLTTSQQKRINHNIEVIKSEFKKHTGRDVNFEINHYSHLRSFSTGDSLEDLNSKVDYLKRQQEKNKPSDPSDGLKKFLFITPNSLNGNPGLGLPDRDAGIASLKDDRGIAHAIGRMFGATRADAEVNYYFPWWYETIMNASNVSELHGNDYRFSDKNGANLRNHLRKFK